MKNYLSLILIVILIGCATKQSKVTYGPTTTSVSASVKKLTLASSGAGYIWYSMPNATADASKLALTAVNDGLTNNFPLLSGASVDSANAYEAIGVIWTTNNFVTKVIFYSGTYITNAGDGVFSANVVLQATTNGTSWFNTAWLCSPVYSYDNQKAGDAAFTFTGTKINVRGVRVCGQVHIGGTATNSWVCNARELEVYNNVTNPPATNFSVTLSWLPTNNVNHYEVWNTTNIIKPFGFLTNAGFATSLTWDYSVVNKPDAMFYLSKACVTNYSVNVTLAWDKSPGTNIITNYKLYWGNLTHSYTNSLSVGTNLIGRVQDLIPGSTYYFAATATDNSGLESDYSSEVIFHSPVKYSTNNIPQALEISYK